MAGCTGSQAVLLPLWPADEHLRGCWLLLLHKCAGRPEASAGPSDKPSLSFSLFSLRVAAASGVSFVRCAHRHTTPLGEPTLVQPDPDDAWTSLADLTGGNPAGRTGFFLQKAREPSCLPNSCTALRRPARRGQHSGRELLIQPLY